MYSSCPAKSKYELPVKFLEILSGLLMLQNHSSFQSFSVEVGRPLQSFFIALAIVQMQHNVDSITVGLCKKKPRRNVKKQKAVRLTEQCDKQKHKPRKKTNEDIKHYISRTLTMWSQITAEMPCAA
jgi:hypothetical protein